MPTVLLVEDDPRVAEAIALMLTLDGRHNLVGSVTTVAAALAMAREKRPDLVLLDLGLPDGSGIDVLRALHAEPRAPLFVVLTVFEDDEHLFGALRAGAVGYLLKADVVVRLLGALDEVAAGGSPMSPGIARRVLGAFAEPPRADPPALLTAREREVIELLVLGATYDEIGRGLEISTNTVRTHIRAIYEKLEVCSRTEATREAIRRGIVERP
jgi:DNA-binding NarL/FixJ family response regulator